MDGSQRIKHPEWRESHSDTKYPFSDAATLQSDTGRFIPASAILDASIYPVGATTGLRLSAVEIDRQFVTFYVGDDNNDRIAYGRIYVLAIPETVELKDAYDRPAGILVSEEKRLAAFQAFGEGLHSFTREAAEFVIDACIPSPDVGFRGFVLADGSAVSGDIWLMGEDGIVLSHRRRQPVDQLGECPIGFLGSVREYVIRVDVVGDPLFRRRLCGDTFTPPQFLRTITAVRGDRAFVCGPDSLGDFKMTVGSSLAEDTILRVRATGDGVRIEAVGEKLNLKGGHAT